MRWCVLMAAALLPAAAGAQEPTEAPPPRPDASAAAPAEELAALPAEEGLLSDDALDDLVAPVALYPDSLLTQVLVAATYPLDVMKADRFLDDNADLPDQERADLVDLEDWDESVRVLAAGFPDVLARMADDIDWTEELGDAMLAQTDDLLDAVQRLRAQAEAVGQSRIERGADRRGRGRLDLDRAGGPAGGLRAGLRPADGLYDPGHPARGGLRRPRGVVGQRAHDRGDRLRQRAARRRDLRRRRR